MTLMIQNHKIKANNFILNTKYNSSYLDGNNNLK